MAKPEVSGECPFLVDLPHQTWLGIFDLYQWQGFWLVPNMVEATRTPFEFHSDDIILASVPKSGTTWLKSLVFSIINPELSSGDPFLARNPHNLIPFLEFQVSTNEFYTTHKGRRVFSTHLPYQLLPESIKNFGCRIVYIARNPRDTFVSSWHFANAKRGEPFPMEEGFESFCRGISHSGPFFDNVLGYWKERDKVHFVKYEDLKEDPHEQVKKLAEFLGYTLNSEEAIDAIVRRCSHERLSNLEINKGPAMVDLYGYKASSFFRRGVVGDWKNYLTAEMIERLDGITSEKLEGTGLSFQVLGKNNGDT